MADRPRPLSGAAQLEHLLERLSDPSLTLPEAAGLRSRLLRCSKRRNTRRRRRWSALKMSWPDGFRARTSRRGPFPNRYAAGSGAARGKSWWPAAAGA